MHFTGAPASHLPSEKARSFQGLEGWVDDIEIIEEFWQTIVESQKRGHSMIGTAKPLISESFNQKVSERGIIASQAYPILDVVEFSHFGKD